jgi:hypothetical protein
MAFTKDIHGDPATDEVIIYASGAVCCSVCAPKGMSREVVEARVNAQNPTGLDHGWAIAPDPTFVGGQPHPYPCNADQGRQHWLLKC